MKALIWISNGSAVFPACAGLLLYRRLEPSQKALCYFFFFVVLIEAANRIMGLQRQNNIWLVNLFVLIECIFLVNVLAHWHGSMIWKWTGAFISVAYATFWLSQFIFMKSIFEVNEYIFTVNALLLIGFSGLTLYHLSDQPTPLSQNPQFWFASGVLLLFSLDVVTFSLLELIVRRGDALLQGTWAIHSVFNVFANVLYTIGFYTCRLQPVK